MNQNNNQDNLIKLVQSSQQNNRWMMATTCLTTATSLIATFVLIWKSFKKAKPSATVRLMRIDSIMAKLEIEKQAIKKEAAYENQRLKLETGLDSENSLPEKENKLDILSNLKQQGQNLVKNQFNKVAGEKINEVVKLVKPKKEE